MFDWDEYDGSGMNMALPLPKSPTDAVPDTERKIKVMQRRVETGRQPHHPGDYRYAAAVAGPDDTDGALSSDAREFFRRMIRKANKGRPRHAIHAIKGV